MNPMLLLISGFYIFRFLELWNDHKNSKTLRLVGILNKAKPKSFYFFVFETSLPLLMLLFSSNTLSPLASSIMFFTQFAILSARIYSMKVRGVFWRIDLEFLHQEESHPESVKYSTPSIDFVLRFLEISIFAFILSTLNIWLIYAGLAAVVLSPELIRSIKSQEKQESNF